VIYSLKLNVLAAITPVFDVTWSFRKKILCSRNFFFRNYYYFQCWKQCENFV